MSRRTGTFLEFQQHTLAIARGERSLAEREPKVWSERLASMQPVSGPEAAHYLSSALRERIVEHVFVGDALRRLWRRGVTEVEVLRSEFDAGGYDLVMSYRKIVRHIQFKSTIEGGRVASVKVSLKLAEKPSGCVIWIIVDPKGLEMTSYRWLGGVPGHPLPDIKGLKPARHTKGNAEGIKLAKSGHRLVPRSHFEPLPTIDAVLDRLFGALP